MPVVRALKAIRDYAILAFGLALLTTMCAAWGVVSAALLVVMPPDPGRRAGRVGAMIGFRAYLSIMQAVGALRLDLAPLDSLREEGPLLIAPNHPSLIDAVLIVSRLPNALCVMKASLLGNFLLGPAARLARYVKNDTLIGLARRAGEELRLGGHLVLFPEGTRTSREPIGPLTAAVGVIARRAGVAVQTVIIEADSRFLGKGWSILARPEFPVHYRIRLGRRFQVATDVRAFTVDLENYFTAELARVESDHGPGVAGRHASECSLPE